MVMGKCVPFSTFLLIISSILSMSVLEGTFVPVWMCQLNLAIHEVPLCRICLGFHVSEIIPS